MSNNEQPKPVKLLGNREIDLELATSLDGWKFPIKSGGEFYAVNPYTAKTTQDPKGNLSAAHQYVPAYTNDINLVLGLVERLVKDDKNVIFKLDASSDNDGLWAASLSEKAISVKAKKGGAPLHSFSCKAAAEAVSRTLVSYIYEGRE